MSAKRIATVSLFFVLPLLLRCFAVAAETPSTTFREFYRTLVRSNPSYVGAALETNASLERRAGANGAYYPTLSAGYSLSDSDATSSRALSSSLAGRIPQLGLTYSSTVYNNTTTLTPPPESNTGTYSLQLGLNLLKDFGPRVGGIPFVQADYTVDTTRIAQTKTSYDLISQLISTYAGAVAAQKNLELNEANIKVNEEGLRVARALHQAGKIPRLSLLTVQTQSQQIRSQVIQGERSLREALKQLYNLSASDEDPNRLAIKNRLEPLPMPFFNENVIQNLVSQRLDLDQTRNPEYLTAKIGIQSGRLSVVQAENNVLPTLSLTATHSTSETSTTRTTRFLPRDEPGNTIALALSVPIGLVTERHELTATRIGFQKTELALEQLRRQLRRDWATLVEDYRLLKAQYQIAKELALSARQKYEASLSTASLGSTYQQNIVTFQNEMLSAQTSLNQLDVEVVTLQFRILTFYGHPHALDVFRKML